MVHKLIGEKMIRRLSVFVVLALLLTGTVEAKRLRYVSIRKKPPQKGTPEFVAVMFVDALIAKKAVLCYSLMNTKAKAYYDDKQLQSAFDECSKWIRNDSYAYKTRKYGSDKAIVSIRYATKEGGGSCDYTLRKVDGKWLIADE